MKIKTLMQNFVSGCIAFVMLASLTSAASAQTFRCWTTVGSAGTVDEGDLGIVSLSTHHAAISSAVSNGTVRIRYNVVAVEGIFGGENYRKSLAVRFADNGSAAKVTVSLQRLNMQTGVITTLAQLNSDDYPSSTVAQLQSVTFNGTEFDFQNNIYYVEVTLAKTATGGNPLIRALRICNAGPS